LPTVRLRQPRRTPLPARALRELAQHSPRQIDPDIVVARGHEWPADSPAARAKIEQARLRGGAPEDRRASGLGHAAWQRAMAIEIWSDGVVCGHQQWVTTEPAGFSTHDVEMRRRDGTPLTSPRSAMSVAKQPPIVEAAETISARKPRMDFY